MTTNELTGKVIRAAIEVHRVLGPGLLESVYEKCLAIELHRAHLHVRTEVAIPITYRGQAVTDEGFRVDLLVQDSLVVELKSVEYLQPVHAKQLLTYLRLGGFHIGLLINFHETQLARGIRRIIDGLGPRPDPSP
jgi:GxxExxY protein